jgi:hypothetical protein
MPWHISDSDSDVALAISLTEDTSQQVCESSVVTENVEHCIYFQGKKIDRVPFKSLFEPLEGSIFIPETRIQDREMVWRNVSDLRSLA